MLWFCLLICRGCQGNSNGEVTVCEVPPRTASVNLRDEELWERLYANLAEMDATREYSLGYRYCSSPRPLIQPQHGPVLLLLGSRKADARIDLSL